jgi:hypothetical protein
MLHTMQALQSQLNLPEEARALGADAVVTSVMQLGCDEYQQTKHNGGITTCSIKNQFADRVLPIAAHVGGDHQHSQKINLATDPSLTVKSVYKQMEEMYDKGYVLVEALPDCPMWGKVKKLLVKLLPLLTSDWPSLVAQAGLGRLSIVSLLVALRNGGTPHCVSCRLCSGHVLHTCVVHTIMWLFFTDFVTSWCCWCRGAGSQCNPEGPQLGNR